MDSKIKAWLISGLTVASSWFGAKAQETSTSENNGAGSTRIEVVNNSSDLSNKTDTITPATQGNNLKNKIAQVPVDSLKNLSDLNVNLVNQISKDSLAINDVQLTTFNQYRMDMLCLIAHWEDIKVVPYKLKGEKFYTYGIGNTLTEDGTRVRKTDYIKDETHLMQVFNNHIDEHIYPYMQKYLPLTKMTSGEICAVVSMAYNCGAGVVSEIAPAIKEYCETRNDSARHVLAKEKIKACFVRHCRSQGVVSPALKARRDFEFKIFTGEIVMKNNRPCTAENEVDLYNSPIGAGYAAYKGRSRTSADICKQITGCPYGKNVPDTIQSEIKKVNIRNMRRTPVNSNVRRTGRSR